MGFPTPTPQQAKREDAALSLLGELAEPTQVTCSGEGCRSSNAPVSPAMGRGGGGRGQAPAWSLSRTVCGTGGLQRASWRDLTPRGGELCFVCAVNKRLDEWVTHDRLDLKKIQFPKKEAKTPTKNGLSGSRPSSPDRDVVRSTAGSGAEGGLSGKRAPVAAAALGGCPAPQATADQGRPPHLCPESQTAGSAGGLPPGLRGAGSACPSPTRW